MVVAEELSLGACRELAPSKQESTTYEPSPVCKLLILGCRLLIPDRLLDMESFEDCLDHPETVAQIDRDVELAGKLGLTGTPGFALGVADETGQVLVRMFVRGAQPVSVFEQAISEVSMNDRVPN